MNPSHLNKMKLAIGGYLVTKPIEMIACYFLYNFYSKPDIKGIELLRPKSHVTFSLAKTAYADNKQDYQLAANLILVEFNNTLTNIKDKNKDLTNSIDDIILLGSDVSVLHSQSSFSSEQDVKDFGEAITLKSEEVFNKHKRNWLDLFAALYCILPGYLFFDAYRTYLKEKE